MSKVKEHAGELLVDNLCMLHDSIDLHLTATEEHDKESHEEFLYTIMTKLGEIIRQGQILK